MALQQRKRRQKAGLPEFVAVILVCAAALPALAWWHSSARPAYRRVRGRILECEIRLTHYNATKDLNKVKLAYEYTLGGNTYSGQWQGFWPAAESPNALPPEQIEALHDNSFPLVVLYKPGHPSQSILHYADHGVPRLYAGLALGALLLAVLYFALFYPAWKQRHRTSW